MADPQGTVWNVQPCNESWEPEGEAVTVTSFWSGATHRTVARDAAEEVTGCWSFDDLDDKFFRYLVWAGNDKPQRVLIRSSVEVSFQGSEVDEDG